MRYSQGRQSCTGGPAEIARTSGSVSTGAVGTPAFLVCGIWGCRPGTPPSPPSILPWAPPHYVVPPPVGEGVPATASRAPVVCRRESGDRRRRPSGRNPLLIARSSAAGRTGANLTLQAMERPQAAPLSKVIQCKRAWAPSNIQAESHRHIADTSERGRRTGVLHGAARHALCGVQFYVNMGSALATAPYPRPAPEPWVRYLRELRAMATMV